MRSLICTAVVIMLAVLAANADSMFDERGAGKDVIPVAGATRAMGGATLASRDPLDCTLTSPFASALAERVTITAGIVHTNTSSENRGEKKGSISTLFPTITVIIPYRGVSFLTGLYLEKQGRLSFALTDSAYRDTYDFDYRRETSVHSVPLYLSASLHPRLVASAGVVFSAFDLRETHAMDFPASGRTDTDDAIDISASGHAFVGGLMVDLDVVRVGALFRSRTDFDGALQRESRYADVWHTKDVGFTSEESYRVGLRFVPHRHFALETDYEKGPWSGLEVDDKAIAENAVYRWSVGMEYRGNILWNAARFPLLAGYYTQPLDWESQLTGEITERVFSVGTSIPVAEDRAAIALSLEFGQCKAEGRNDLSESFYGLSVSVSAVETWRREERTRP